jgi:class 3 adenylate cyclase
VDEVRHRLDDALLRAHECVAAAGLGLSGPELASAERSARALIKLAPYRESGYRFMMQVLAYQGNVAEALLTYERLRRLLRDELGASPGPATQAVHKRLLQGDVTSRISVVRDLKTVFFTDIVGSTELAAALGDRGWHELLSQHHAIVRQQLEKFGGHEVDAAGDGFLATFEGPAQAVACACDIMQSVGGLGIRVRMGIHTGECEVLEGRVSGIAVHVGARIAAMAGAGELLVSSTVKDLMAGSGIGFDDRGSHVLRGVPGEWRLFAVQSETVPRRPAH